MTRIHRRITRHHKANSIYDLVSQMLNGLDEHPNALDDIKGRLRISSLNRIKKDFIKFEKEREKAEELIARTNEKERALIREVEDDLRHLLKMIEAKYYNRPEILEDFTGEG